MAISFRDVRTAFGLATLGLAAGLVASCGAGHDGFEKTEPKSFGEGGVPDVDCSHVICSRDLKKVLRGCEGAETVAEVCGEGLGCGDGRCMPACESAALSKGSLGCEFSTIPPDDKLYNHGDCFVAMIANTWDTPVSITAELGAEPLDISKSVYTAKKDGAATIYTRVEGKLPPKQVGLVFLSEAKEKILSGREGTLCPPDVVPAYANDPMTHGTAMNRAFHLKTDAPVSAYSIYPYGGAPSFIPSATLLLPVSSWGKNYLAVTAATIFVDKQGPGLPDEGLANRTLQLVAHDDDTEVRVLPTADISPVGGVGAASRGKPATFKLSRGQVLQLNQSNDLAGSVIEANRPVGLFGGSECTNFPVTYYFCDVTQQQILPVSQWGGQYALVPYRPRIGADDARDQVPWSLVGAVDGTELVYDPVRPFGAPAQLASGERVTFITDQLVTVRSQDSAHPFYASVYMTGSKYGGRGDPDFVNVIPSAQFLDRYVFFADFTFADTSLTLVRRRTPQGFAPVRLECGGEVSGWKPLGTSGEFEFAWVPLTKGHSPVRLEGGECGYGLHVAESDGPFGVTVWGIDVDASYGYPGGMALRPISEIQIPVVK